MTPQPINRLNIALAVCNLRRLGHAPEAALTLAQDWSRRQGAQSLDAIGHQLRQALPSALARRPSIHDPGRGRLIASCHFSLYPLLFGILAVDSPQRRVVSLIGQQSLEHQTHLRSLAARFDVDLRFVAGGFHVMREMRRALAEGHHGLVLVDIPWSPSGAAAPLDEEHNASGGRFRARSTLYRLISAIDPHARFLLVERDIGSDRRCSYRVVDHGPANANQNYARFAEALARDPADYERLHQFHHFFTFDEQPHTAVHVRVGSESYLICGSTMKAWRLDRNLCGEVEQGVTRAGRLLDQSRQLTRLDVREVIAV